MLGVQFLFRRRVGYRPWQAARLRRRAGRRWTRWPGALRRRTGAIGLLRRGDSTAGKPPGNHTCQRRAQQEHTGTTPRKAARLLQKVTRLLVLEPRCQLMQRFGAVIGQLAHWGGSADMGHFPQFIGNGNQPQRHLLLLEGNLLT
jgi:hypothetical protein